MTQCSHSTCIPTQEEEESGHGDNWTLKYLPFSFKAAAPKFRLSNHTCFFVLILKVLLRSLKGILIGVLGDQRERYLHAKLRFLSEVGLSASIACSRMPSVSPSFTATRFPLYSQGSSVLLCIPELLSLWLYRFVPEELSGGYYIWSVSVLFILSTLVILFARVYSTTGNEEMGRNPLVLKPKPMHLWQERDILTINIPWKGSALLRASGMPVLSHLLTGEPKSTFSFTCIIAIGRYVSSRMPVRKPGRDLSSWVPDTGNVVLFREQFNYIQYNKHPWGLHFTQ